jgi:GTP-binding protein Era
MNKQKTNWISLIGIPNVGKSTLLNALVGQKISIVTPKPQTTRNLIRGIRVIDGAQLIFVDTPGIFAPKNQAGKVMVKLAWQGIAGVDQVFFITDVSRYNSDENMPVLKNLNQEKVRASLIINKIDLIKKEDLLGIIDSMKELYPFENIFLVSAMKKNGLKDLLDYLVNTASNEPWPFSEGEITDAPFKFQVSEIIREKIFMNTHEEIPYNVEVEILSVKEEENMIRISADILVRSESHKKIIIGKGASLIKKIGMAARIELEKSLKKKIFLATNVKVTKTPFPIRYE